MAPSTSLLSIPELTAAIFDNIPTGELTAALEQKIQIIHSTLEGEKNRDPLLQDLCKVKQGQKSAYKQCVYLAKSAIVLAIDWQAMSQAEIFRYLVYDFPGDVADTADSIYKELSGVLFSVNDALVVPRQGVTYDISAPNRITRMSELLKEEVPRLVEGRKTNTENVLGFQEQVNRLMPGATGESASFNPSKMNPLWDLGPGYIPDERSESTRALEAARVLVNTRRFNAWKAEHQEPDEEFPKTLEADKEAVEAEVRAEAEKEFRTFMKRTEVKLYLYQWKWHLDNRIKNRVQHIVSALEERPNASPTTISDEIMLEKIRGDLGEYFPQNLRRITSDFKHLLGAYVAMEELKLSLADEQIVLNRESLERNLAIAKSDDLSQTVGALFVEDHGIPYMQIHQGEEPIGARLANRSERHALHYLRTGERFGSMESGAYITFKDVARSLELLAASHFKTEHQVQDIETVRRAGLIEADEADRAITSLRGAHEKVELSFSDPLNEESTMFKLRQQVGDFSSEKFYLNDKSLGFLGFSGRVAHTANTFLSEKNKFKLADKKSQITDQKNSLFVKAAALCLFPLTLAELLFDEVSAPNPASILLEPSSSVPVLGPNTARVAAERAAANVSAGGPTPS